MNNNLRQVIEKYKYMEFLESVEKDLYDENEVLIEEKLASFNSKKFPLPPLMLEETIEKDPYIFLRVMAMIPVIFRIIFMRLRKRLSGKRAGKTFMIRNAAIKNRFFFVYNDRQYNIRGV